MIAASTPVQRPRDARLLVSTACGEVSHRPRAQFPDLLRAGDLVVANDAATMPASLTGTHQRTGRVIEVRLAVRRSINPADVREFDAVVFGEGDYRTVTELRAAPPELRAGDVVQVGPLRATIARVLDHPRFVTIQFDGTPRAVWDGIARHGRPIQYAHVPVPLAVWDTWTPMAGPPVAFEPPSAGFVLDWSTLRAFAQRHVRFATLTHAAGISSSGDAALDARLPFDEPYRIPAATARAVERARARGGRIVAVGTTVVRALEHSAGGDGTVRAGNGVANQRIGKATRLRVVDAILSGTHERGTSHHELLRAFCAPDVLERADAELDVHAYRTHEFGDSVFIESATSAACRGQHHAAAA